MKEIFLLLLKLKDPIFWLLIILLISYLLVLSLATVFQWWELLTPQGQVADEKMIAKHNKFKSK